jgi:hypothetical protein
MLLCTGQTAHHLVNIYIEARRSILGDPRGLDLEIQIFKIKYIQHGKQLFEYVCKSISYIYIMPEYLNIRRSSCHGM